MKIYTYNGCPNILYNNRNFAQREELEIIFTLFYGHSIYTNRRKSARTRDLTIMCHWSDIFKKELCLTTISPLVQMAAWIRLSTIVQWWRRWRAPSNTSTLRSQHSTLLQARIICVSHMVSHFSNLTFQTSQLLLPQKRIEADRSLTGKVPFPLCRRVFNNFYLSWIAPQKNSQLYL